MLLVWTTGTLRSRLSGAFKRVRADTSVECRPSTTVYELKAHSQQKSSRHGPTAAYLKARVNGRTCYCLLDSGADVSLIPSHFVNTLEVQKCEQSLRAANNTMIRVDGQIDLKLTVDKQRLHARFIVSPNTDEIILGRDWLHEHNVAWNFQSNVVMINGQPCTLHARQQTPQCKRCRLSSDVEVPPSGESLIPVDLVYGNFTHPAKEELWTTVPSEAVSGISVARTLISSDRPTAFVRVCNALPRPIILHKGQLLCNVQEVYPANENNVSSESTLSANSVATRTAAERTPDAQRQTIINRIDPSVPSEVRTQLQELMASYSEIFSYGEYDLGCTTMAQHDINTGHNRPFRQPLRPQPWAYKPAIDQLIDDMQAQGVIEPCQSDWASNIVIVKKKDKSIRFCVDYRHLNSLTQKDAYPLPRIDTCLDTLSGAAWYSTFDLRSGFHQVPVNPRDINKTAFICHRGSYRFPRMPFGMCNAPATFQRLMDTVLKNLNFEICLAYIDDIIVFSHDLSSHMERLNKLFQRLKEANLKLKISKCNVLQKQVTFLGFSISQRGVGTDVEKVAAVRDWPVPTNLKQCRAFVGLCQYYRRFVPRFSEIAAPLHALTKKGARFIWNEECQSAFNTLKSALVGADVLALPNETDSFILDCDASDQAMGAVLSQVQNGEERPICYASQLYDSHQQNYNVTRKELLAVVTFVKKFRQYLLGRPFVIRSDHAALQWLRKTPEPIGQQARWLEILEEFDFQIEHRAGSKHGNADALSRRICATTQNTNNDSDPDAGSVDWPIAQQKDPSLKLMYQLLKEGKPKPAPEALTAYCAEVKNLCRQYDSLVISNSGILCRRFCNNANGQTHLQIIVPRELRQEIAAELHKGLNGGHLGTRRAESQLQKRFYWPGWASDVRLAKRLCDQCGKYQKPRPQRQGGLQTMVVGEPWERIGVDITGPHPRSSNGHVYILTVIDHFTKWVELFPMRDQEAATVAKLLVDRVICVHGCPIQILTDQGANFESELFRELCKRLNIDKIRTTAYRPQTNGNIERFHATMHGMFAKWVSDNQRDWDQKLAAIAFAYNTSQQESTQFTPFFLQYGREARIPADLVYGLPPDANHQTNTSLPEFVLQQRDTLHDAFALARQHLGASAERRKRQYDMRTRPREFHVGTWVWCLVPRLRSGRYRKWQSPYHGPFLVIKQLGPLNYLIQRTARSKPWTVHVDKLKECLSAAGLSSWLPTDMQSDNVACYDGHDQVHSEPAPLSPRPRRQTRLPLRYQI